MIVYSVIREYRGANNEDIGLDIRTFSSEEEAQKCYDECVEDSMSILGAEEPNEEDENFCYIRDEFGSYTVFITKSEIEE